MLLSLNSDRYPNEKMTRMIGLGSRFMLIIPIIGIHYKLWGFQSVDPRNLSRLMAKGAIIGMVPGGY